METSARDRILSTASRLFYAQGIHAVGVDLILTEAKSTRASLYRHFPGKEELVRAYVQTTDSTIRSSVTAALADLPPRAALDKLVQIMAAEMCGPGFRGCAFINAAAEYPDPTNPVSIAIADHRNWLRSSLVDLVDKAGIPDAEYRGYTLLLLRDGATVSAALSDPEAVRTHFEQAVRQLLFV
jgi:AcrR family transcriptional regulator